MRCGYSLRRKPHLFFVFLFVHNSHSNLECGHIDKKDTFADIGKSSHNERFVFTWAITPPFATFSHTRILCITQNYIKNEQTTTNHPTSHLVKVSYFSGHHAEANNVKNLSYDLIAIKGFLRLYYSPFNT